MFVIILSHEEKLLGATFIIIMISWPGSEILLKTGPVNKCAFRNEDGGGMRQSRPHFITTDGAPRPEKG